MRAIRLAAVVVIVAFAGYAIDVLVARAWRCNIVKKRAQTRTLGLLDIPFGPAIARVAHRQIADEMRCLATCPTDVDTYMTIAVAQRIVGRQQGAVEMYRTALQFDRRPEIFFNLGIVLLQLNDVEGARTAFLDACRFNIDLANQIPDPKFGDSIARAVRAERARAMAAAR